jgi:hypothetical protein
MMSEVFPSDNFRTLPASRRAVRKRTKNKQNFVAHLFGSRRGKATCQASPRSGLLGHLSDQIFFVPTSITLVPLIVGGV